LIEIDKKIEINKILSIIFSEEGFKKSILNNIIPSLNNNIEKLLTLLNINFEMTFNNLFQIKIKNNGLEISDNTLSTGENKKLNLIIIFSLYILLKYQYGDINILFLDEVFAGLDMNSQDTIIEILNRLKSFLDINIFIIHHNDFEECNFDRILYTKKENQFSELTIIEN
jgi:DNA repair exonuclease SbcCD ATPase subunit